MESAAPIGRGGGGESAPRGQPHLWPAAEYCVGLKHIKPGSCLTSRSRLWKDATQTRIPAPFPAPRRRRLLAQTRTIPAPCPERPGAPYIAPANDATAINSLAIASRPGCTSQ